MEISSASTLLGGVAVVFTHHRTNSAAISRHPSTVGLCFSRNGEIPWRCSCLDFIHRGGTSYRDGGIEIESRRESVLERRDKEGVREVNRLGARRAPLL
jgi:hypothetical protein